MTPIVAVLIGKGRNAIYAREGYIISRTAAGAKVRYLDDGSSQLLHESLYFVDRDKQSLWATLASDLKLLLAKG